MYNESIYDLLEEQPAGALGPRPTLRLKEDAHGRVFVAGLSEARASQLPAVTSSFVTQKTVFAGSVVLRTANSLVSCCMS